MSGAEVTLRAARWGRYLTWTVVALWVAAAFLLTPLAGKTGAVESTDPALALPRSAEATRAMIREREAFPGGTRPWPS